MVIFLKSMRQNNKKKLIAARELYDRCKKILCKDEEAGLSDRAGNDRVRNSHRRRSAFSILLYAFQHSQ